MREAVVPGFTLRESQDSVTLAWESADGTPLRARFKRRGEALYLLAVETRTRPRTRLDAGAEEVEESGVR